MQVNFDFEDHSGKHFYYYDYKNVPRVNDFVEIKGSEYKVTKVTWRDGVPTCKLRS